MNDNKLKIRIQIQQPPQAIEQIYPDLPEPVITYEQFLDWKKISIAVLSLASILIFISYFLFNSNKNEILINEAAPSTDQTIPTHENKISPDKVKLESEIKDKIIEVESNGSISEHNALVNSIQPKEIINPVKKATAPIAKSKPTQAVNKPTVSPRKKPKAAMQLELQRTLDRPQVLRAQLSHAIKAGEPVDSINSVQLRKGVSKPIYFFLHLKNLGGKKVSIFWYHKNKLDSQLTLQIHHNNWRSYASKQLDNKRLGAWRVELMNESGVQLAVRNFTVTTH